LIAYRYNGVSLGNINPGIETIWLDDVSCRGSETDIASCPHSGWGIHNCGHHEDVSVRCTGSTITGIVKRRCSLIYKCQKIVILQIQTNPVITESAIPPTCYIAAARRYVQYWNFRRNSGNYGRLLMSLSQNVDVFGGVA